MDEWGCPPKQLDFWGWHTGLFRVMGDLLPVVPDIYLGVVYGFIQGQGCHLPVAPDRYLGVVLGVNQGQV